MSKLVILVFEYTHNEYRKEGNGIWDESKLVDRFSQCVPSRDSYINMVVCACMIALLSVSAALKLQTTQMI